MDTADVVDDEDLCAGLGILYAPSLVDRHEQLAETLERSIEWDQRMRARKTASYGAPYNYSGMEYPAVPMHSAIARIRDIVAARVGYAPNNCLVNLYATGRHRMGFHYDGLAELTPGTGVAIVSLGATRTLWFRAMETPAREFARPLPGGSLLYMPAAIQREWKHGIRREPGAGRRISLTFRQLVGADTELHDVVRRG